MEGELPPLARPLLTNRDETTVGFADDWTPSHVKVALNLTLNAEFVPASANVRDLSSLPGAPRCGVCSTTSMLHMHAHQWSSTSVAKHARSR